MVVVTPSDNVFFPDQIHGTDQLHALKIGAAELGHHALVLTGVEHAHENSLDHIIVMVSQGDLVAAAFFSKAVEVTAAHAGAEIAGGFFDGVDSIKDAGITEFDRDAEEPGVFFDELTVFRQISGIHAQENK